MNKIKRTNLVAMIIGLVGVAFGLYGLMAGSPFQHYFLSLLIGISLFGTAYLNNNAWKKIENKNENTNFKGKHKTS